MFGITSRYEKDVAVSHVQGSGMKNMSLGSQGETHS